MAQYPSFWTRRRSAAILFGLQATATKSRAVETSQNAGIIVAQVLNMGFAAAPKKSYNNLTPTIDFCGLQISGERGKIYPK